MNRLRFVSCVLLAVAVAGCAAPPPSVDGDIAFVSINVVSMRSDQVTAGQTVIVEDGIVTRVVPEGSVTLADGILAIDGTDRYLMPALADMHTHLSDTESLQLNVAYGVTALRNLWGNEEILGWRDAVAAGDLFGPEILTASPIIDHDPPSNPGLFHGWSLHDELANLVRWAGLSPYQAIKTVTVNAAKYWNKEGERGIVAPGAEADLLLLAANPLVDISNTRAIEGLVINGTWLDRENLDALLKSVSDSYAARSGAAALSGLH